MTEKNEFKTIHARAHQIVDEDPALAYAVSTALRKRVIGRTPDTARYELLTNLAYSVWNQFIELEKMKESPKYTVRMLNLISDTTILAYDILTERHSPHANPDSRPSR